jgi:hypothetical protein
MIATPVQEVTSGKYGKTDLCGPSYGVLYTRMLREQRLVPRKYLGSKFLKRSRSSAG